MIFGHSDGERLPLYSTPHFADMGAYYGIKVGKIFHRAINQQATIDEINRRINSYVSDTGTINADPDTALAYARLLLHRSEYLNYESKALRFGHALLSASVELRLTEIESTTVLGVGKLQAADFQKGTVVLDTPEGERQEVCFAEIMNKEIGDSHAYLGNIPAADFQVYSTKNVPINLFHEIDNYLR